MFYLNFVFLLFFFIHLNHNKKNPTTTCTSSLHPKKTNKTILISYQPFVQKQAQIWIKNSNTYANVDAISILDGEACVFFIIRKFVEIRCRRNLIYFPEATKTHHKETRHSTTKTYTIERKFILRTSSYFICMSMFSHFKCDEQKSKPDISLAYLANVEPSTSDSEMHFAISVSTQQIRLWLSDHLLKSASNMFCGIRVSIYFHKQLTAEIFHLNFDSSTRIIRF